MRRESPQTEPAVTVVVPMFNASRTIVRCLRSALGQTLSQIEIVVVDDVSADDSVTLVESLEDPRIRLLRNEQNSGPARTRNAAFDAARGQWISILDADDWWDERRLERLLAHANEGRPEILVDDPAYVLQGATNVTTTLLGHLGLTCTGFRELDLPTLLRYQMLQFKPTISREFLERHGLRYPVNLRLGEDQVFFLDCLIHGARVGLLPEPLYLYELPTAPRQGANQMDFLRGLAAFVEGASSIPDSERGVLDDYLGMRRAEYLVRRYAWKLRRGELAGERPSGVKASHLLRTILRLGREALRLRAPRISHWPGVRTGRL